MSKQTEALKLALEALKALTHSLDYEDLLHDDQRNAFKQSCAAIIAMREALAQPEQGYTTTRNAWTGKATHKCNACGRDDFRSEHAAKFHTCEALAEQPAQQPHCNDCGGFDPECPLAQPVQQEIEELTAQRDKLADILTRTANALKGQPAELSLHSWHDLPEVAQQLKAAQQQEPVAYIHRQGNHWEVSERFLCDDEKARGWTEEPLYTSPQPLPEEYTTLERALTRLQKRYADLESGVGKPTGVKPWVGLTDEEAAATAYKGFDEYWTEDCKGREKEAWAAAGRAIEAKLREKNTGEQP